MPRAIASSGLAFLVLAAPPLATPAVAEPKNDQAAAAFVDASRRRIAEMIDPCAGELSDPGAIIVCGNRAADDRRYRIAVEPDPGARGTQSVMEERVALMSPDGSCTTIGPHGCPGRGTIPVIPIVEALVSGLIGLAQDDDD